MCANIDLFVTHLFIEKQTQTSPGQNCANVGKKEKKKRPLNPSRKKL